MLRILIVEDEPLFAQTLRHLVELNPRYEVTAVAEDSASALAAARADAEAWTAVIPPSA